MSEKAKAGRREFLKLAGVGVATGGAAMVLGQKDAEAKDTVSKTSAGYRETEHVKKYYELARF
jgi:hypothetical protein